MLDLLQASEKRIQLRNLEKQIENPDLGFNDYCELEDQILEIKEALGEFERSCNQGGECVNCSG